MVRRGPAYDYSTTLNVGSCTQPTGPSTSSRPCRGASTGGIQHTLISRHHPAHNGDDVAAKSCSRHLGGHVQDAAQGRDLARDEARQRHRRVQVTAWTRYTTASSGCDHTQCEIQRLYSQSTATVALPASQALVLHHWHCKQVSSGCLSLEVEMRRISSGAAHGLGSPLKLAEAYTRVAMEKPKTSAISTTRALVSGQSNPAALASSTGVMSWRQRHVTVVAGATSGRKWSSDVGVCNNARFNHRQIGSPSMTGEGRSSRRICHWCMGSPSATAAAAVSMAAMWQPLHTVPTPRKRNRAMHLSAHAAHERSQPRVIQLPKATVVCCKWTK